MQIQGLPARDFLRELYRCIGEDNVFNGAAALAFYLTLAIFPALIVLMSVIPYLPIEDVDQAIMDLIGQALPEQSATLVDESSRRSRRSSVARCCRWGCLRRSGLPPPACTP